MQDGDKVLSQNEIDAMLAGATTPRPAVAEPGWSAGRSIGAEPYSIAMMLHKLPPGHRHRILATDRNEIILEKAAAEGRYSAPEATAVTQEFADKHLLADGDGYQVVDKIRHRVEYRLHDMLTGLPELGFSLIFCRKVMIYFTDKDKHNLPGGFAKGGEHRCVGYPYDRSNNEWS